MTTATAPIPGQAAELRAKAMTARDEVACEKLRRLAEEYDRLADAFDTLKAGDAKSSKR